MHRFEELLGWRLTMEIDEVETGEVEETRSERCSRGDEVYNTC